MIENNRIEHALSLIDVGIIELNKNHKIKDLSKGIINIFGLKKTTLIKQHINILFNKKNHEKLFTFITSASKKNVTIINTISKNNNQIILKVIKSKKIMTYLFFFKK